MNVNLLIDAIVKQTMVLIAQLATSAGIRSPLAHLANQVFLDLVHELQSQGLGRKVIADMFGLALRSYHAKMRRLSESETLRGQSLWEAIYDFIESEENVNRATVLRQFCNDDSALVRGVLKDLVSSGLVTQTGRGSSTVYRMTSDAERDEMRGESPEEAATALIWVVIHRHSPMAFDDLVEQVRLEPDQLDLALEHLLDDGRVRKDMLDGKLVLRSDACVIPVGSEAGWEAALFDHYQALVTAMCAKLRSGDNRSSFRDAVGGSTYTIDMWHGHPLQEEVLDLLRSTRERVTQLREEVEAVKRPPSVGPESDLRVIFYTGQSVLGEEPDM